LLQSSIEIAGHPYTFQLASAVAGFYAVLSRMGWTMLASIPIMLIIAALGGYWMSRRALAPVDQITSAAQSIGEASLSARLSVPQTGDELQRLTETLNQMLERLETAFQRISQFTADASHELPTPVALIRTTSELLMQQPPAPEEYQESVGQILVESERMTRLI
jgi:signal transduction histidine kinase